MVVQLLTSLRQFLWALLLRTVHGREEKHGMKNSTGVEAEEAQDLGSSSPGSSSHRAACCTRHRGMPRQMW